MSIDMMIFKPWLDRWGLQPDGSPIAGTWAKLLPVLRDGEPAMLKAGMTAEEKKALNLLAWYDGDGAVRILERDEKAILMERAVGERSLKAMAKTGDDEGPLTVLCAAATRLHAPRTTSPPDTLVPLSVRFEPLRQRALTHGGILARCWTEAQSLLATSRDERPLHGDLWHDNMRDDRRRGWLAIDPKGFHGERTYDYAIMISTPEFPSARPSPEQVQRRARHCQPKVTWC